MEKSETYSKNGHTYRRKIVFLLAVMVVSPMRLMALHLANNEELVKRWIKKNKRTDISIEDVRQTFTKENLKKCRMYMEYYSISFCQKNDLLSQWAIYARESGVSIEMNFERDSYHFKTESVETGGAKSDGEQACFPTEAGCIFSQDSLSAGP